MVAVLPLVGGCGSGKEYSPTLPEEHTQLRQLAVLLGQFQSRNRGQLPRSEQEFKKFLQGLPAEQRQSMGVTDIDAFFVSKRDGEPLIIRYGQAGGPPGLGGPSKAGEPGKGPSEPVVAYEKTGIEGKRLVAHSTGRVELVDEQQFQQLIKP
jgi:hypothetical protein